MPKLGNMIGETGTIEIPVPGDEPLVVTYRRGVLTPRLQKELVLFQARSQGADGGSPADPASLDFMVDIFARLIASWNLTDDAGETIGTDAESLADVDMGILTMVMQEIGRAVSPDPLSGNGSNNGSTPRVDLEPRLITTAS